LLIDGFTYNMEKLKTAILEHSMEGFTIGANGGYPLSVSGLFYSIGVLSHAAFQVFTSWIQQ
jgi:hypothetical protein